MWHFLSKQLFIRNFSCRIWSTGFSGRYWGTLIYHVECRISLANYKRTRSCIKTSGHQGAAHNSITYPRKHSKPRTTSLAQKAAVEGAATTRWTTKLYNLHVTDISLATGRYLRPPRNTWPGYVYNPLNLQCIKAGPPLGCVESRYLGLERELHLFLLSLMRAFSDDLRRSFWWGCWGVMGLCVDSVIQMARYKLLFENIS